jgi:ATP-dependent exoDNAse (exonuclease V) alpha subunit
MKFICADSDNALDYLVKHNVFLTGPPGSGKSYLINKFIEWANNNNVTIAITASTGIAAKIINGSTLHSWAGIGLGQDSKEKLLEDIKAKPFRRRNWKSTQILIIDEVSMISGELWMTLDWIGRQLRKPNVPFGGIKVIAVGDFFQLPPVKGKMLIESDINFEKYFDFGICLNKNYRSSDSKLTQILSQVRDGAKLSSEQNALLKSKVSETEIKYPILVSLRETARDMNNTKLDELTEIEYKYNSDIYCVNTKTTSKIVPDGIHENLKKIAFADCTMEKILVLKKGAPVIYLINDPQTGLANGSVGIVEDFINGNPVVKFQFVKVEINKHQYKKDFVNDVTVIVEQYPLLLAYAITIHRAQGQTLSQGTILLDSTVWEDGQAYVALSRLQSLDNLSLLKYDPKVFKVSAKVKEFYCKFKNQNQEINL